MDQQPKQYKVSVNVSPEIYQAIQEISQKRNISMAQAVRRAIGTEKFLLDESEEGNKILVEDRDRKRVRELVLR